mgnify:CR=1 FL=1
MKGRVHHGLDRLGSHHKVHHRSERSRHLAHEIRACQAEGSGAGVAIMTAFSAADRILGK